MKQDLTNNELKIKDALSSIISYASGLMTIIESILQLAHEMNSVMKTSEKEYIHRYTDQLIDEISYMDNRFEGWVNDLKVHLDILLTGLAKKAEKNLKNF